jgi:putative tricarboxylic transport membrane protein
VLGMAKDRIAGIILLLFCAFFYYQSTLIEVKDLTGLQATFFPRLLLGLISILVIMMIIQSYIKKEKTSNKDTTQSKKGWVVWTIFTLFSIYVLFLKIIGFIISSFLFMAVIYFILLPEKKPVKSYVIALSSLLAITILLTLVFQNFLNVFLPSGIFF